MAKTFRRELFDQLSPTRKAHATKRVAATPTRNPQDATLRNIRALKSRVAKIEERLIALENKVRPIPKKR